MAKNFVCQLFTEGTQGEIGPIVADNAPGRVLDAAAFVVSATRPAFVSYVAQAFSAVAGSGYVELRVGGVAVGRVGFGGGAATGFFVQGVLSAFVPPNVTVQLVGVETVPAMGFALFEQREVTL